MPQSQIQAIEDAYKRLEAVRKDYNEDRETMHTKAEDILIGLLRELGGGKVADLYDKIYAEEGFICA